MKGNQTNGWSGALAARKWGAACAASCRKLLGQLREVRTAILDESRRMLDSQEHLLELALNEAEALAAQTGYPHLVFPVLAAEKVRSVAAWDARQQRVRRKHTGLVPALVPVKLS